ncbi:MAG: type II secretion system protein N, partial [Sphingomonas sp.]
MRSRPAAIFGGVFILGLVAFLPMRLATGAAGLGDMGFGARSVSGTVWSGRFDEASVGALPIGDLRAGISPFDLLIGRMHISFSPMAGAASPKGRLVLGRHLVGIDVETASLSAGAAFSPLPVSELDLANVAVRFEDGICSRAAGRVRAVMSGGVAGIDFGGAMSGEARCEGGALLLPLVSASGAERVVLRISGAGHYHA